MAKSHHSSKGMHGAMKHLHEMHKGHADHQHAHGGKSHFAVQNPEARKSAVSNTSELASMHTRKSKDTTPSKPC